MAIVAFTFLAFTLLIIESDGGGITCTSGGECQNQTRDCPQDSSSCVVTCASNGGCKNTTINCLDGQFCRVDIGGEEAGFRATINGNAATRLEVYTAANGEKQLEYASITCPTGGTCKVSCNGGGYHNCHSSYIYAETAQDLWLECEEANECCNSVDVWCPKTDVSGNCVLDGQPTSAAGMTDLQIYSVNGFRTVTIYDGTAESVGQMNCLYDYSANCIIETPSPTQAQCVSTQTPTICDNPPTATPAPTVQPTIDPTIDPTYDPTSDPTIGPTIDRTNEPTIDPTVDPTIDPTADPTTYPTTEPTIYPSIDPTIYPTTAVPTTAMPTTAQPTTSIPTTATPTTASPSTSNPTTISPTTNLPTTDSPTTHNPTTATPTTPPPTPKQATNNYTITIEGKDTNTLNQQQIEAIIINSLNISSDDIISTKIDGDSITILISIPTDIPLDEDIIQQHVEEGLVKEYGDDLDISITVKDPNDNNKHDTTKHPLSFITDNVTTLILAIIGIILVIVCTVLCIMLCRKNKNAKKALNDQDVLSKSVAITTTTPQSTNGKEKDNDDTTIEMQAVTDTDPGYTEINTTINETVREETMGDTARDVTYTIGDTSALPEFQDDIDSDSNGKDMDDMYTDHQIQTTGGGTENDQHIADRSDSDDDGNGYLYDKGSGKTPMKPKQDTNNNDDT